jgi:hypothetical protein
MTFHRQDIQKRTGKLAEKACQPFMRNVSRKEHDMGTEPIIEHPLNTAPLLPLTREATRIMEIRYTETVELLVPGDCVAGNRGAHFVRPCPVALRRNKALCLPARPSCLRPADRSAGERRDYASSDKGGAVEKFLVNMAIVKVNWDSSEKDLLDNYIPLVAYVLKIYRNDIISLEEFKDELTRVAEFEMPTWSHS